MTGVKEPVEGGKGPALRFTRKDLLGLEDLSREEIQLVLDTAESFKEISTREIKKVPTLRGKTVVTLFYEPSTRTRMSFEIAAKRLSADTVAFSASGSSVSKGETLVDTARNIEAMKPDAIVIRHASSGTPRLLASALSCPVINAGDGSHEHPTQGLLDLFTIREKKGRIEGLEVAIVGDILHSRVARSNLYGLTKMGATVRFAGPGTLLPEAFGRMGAKLFYRIEDAIRGADVVMMLRLQLERQGKGFFPNTREYSRFYGLNRERVKLASPDVLILHPGPVNRGVEISPEVADGPGSVILDQVTNGVAIRMAVLYLLIERERGGAAPS